MKYALFLYDAPGTWHGASTEQKHALHEEYHALAEFPGLIAHYRFQPPQTTTTVRVEDDQVVKSPGPLVDASETLRALYLLESDDHDGVLELAARTPAARMGRGRSSPDGGALSTYSLRPRGVRAPLIRCLAGREPDPLHVVPKGVGAIGSLKGRRDDASGSCRRIIG